MMFKSADESCDWQIKLDYKSDLLRVSFFFGTELKTDHVIELRGRTSNEVIIRLKQKERTDGK